MENKKSKSKKDAETVSKLRQELSALRQVKNKMRRREYNRRAKHQKVLERRKRRRDYIMQQIELGNMDKSALALIYSRKKLPCDQPKSATEPQLLPPSSTVEYVIDETAAAVAGISGSQVTYHVETVETTTDNTAAAAATTIITTDADGTVISTSTAADYGQEQIDIIMKAVGELEHHSGK